MYRILVILTLFVFTACESTPETGGDAAPDTTVQSPDNQVDRAPSDQDGRTNGPESNGSNVGVSLQTLVNQSGERDEQGHLTVLDRLNEPSNVSVNTVKNRHNPNQIDTLRTRHYDGLLVRVYHVAGGKEIMKGITVTDSRYEVEDGVHVGMSRSTIEEAWGTPTRKDNREYLYERGGEMPTMVRVEFSGDTVSQIKWDYPID